MRESISGLATAIALFAFNTTHLVAAVIPPDLPPGSQYQLIFVTAGEHSAISGDINVYNAFVTAEALLNPLLPSGVTWHAVASTTSVNARDNAPSGALPVYNTLGEKVASAGVGLYTGSLLTPILYQQFGEFAETEVWTGSLSSGVQISNPEVQTALGNPEPFVGYAFDTGPAWISGAPWLSSFSRPLYALSTAITVEVPEPSALALAAMAVIGLAGWGWRRDAIRKRPSDRNHR